MKAPTTLETPCREWRGARTPKGYGTRTVDDKTVYIHRWVMSQGMGRDLLPGEQALHRCDNPPCFRFDHLFLGTAAVNTADMMAKGRNGFGRTGPNQPACVQGEKNPSAKLTEKEVHEIRQLVKDGVRHLDISERFGIGRSTVSAIATRRLWPHLRRECAS